MGTAAAIGVGLQLLADTLGVVQQLNAGQLTDAQAMQLLAAACNGATTAIDKFVEDTSAPAAPPT